MQENRLVALLAAIKFTHILDFMIMMPLGPQLMRLWGVSPSEFGLLVSAYTFSAGICGLAFSFVLDRFERRQALVFLYAGFLLGTLMCAMAESYAMLLAARLLAGAFGGLLGAQVLAIVGDAIPLQRRAAAMGKMMSAFSLASVAGVPFGLFLADRMGWHAPFLFIVAVGALLAAAAWRFIPVMTGHLQRKDDQMSLRQAVQELADPDQLRAHLFIVLLMVGQFSVIPFIAPYMVKNVGLSESQLPLIYLVGGALTFFSNPLVGRLADRFGRLRVFTVLAVLSLFPLWIMTNMGPVGMVISLAAVGLFFVFVTGRIVPAMTMVSAVVPPQKRGTFMGMNTAVQQLASGAGSYVAGLMVTTAATGQLMGYANVGYMAIVASVAAMFMARWLRAVA
jgi:predicted MFS family arabinose efflux permease